MYIAPQWFDLPFWLPCFDAIGADLGSSVLLL
jgi:hypothetical protein